MSFFVRIDDEFRQQQCRGALDLAFRRWAHRGGGWRRVQSLDQLVVLCRDPEESAFLKNDFLLALCAEANAADEDAKLLLLWLMLPGLLRLRGTLPWEVEGLSSDQIDADVLLGFCTGVAAVEPGTAGVAARLLNAARHEACESLQKHIGWAERAELGADQPERSTVMEDPTFDAFVEASMPDVDELLGRALREGVLTALQLELIRAGGREVRTVGAQWGLTPNQASCRRYRAAARLARWLAEQCGDGAIEKSAKE